MAAHKQYLYTKGTDPVLDAQYGLAKAYGKVRPGADALFWRSGLRRYAIPMSEIRRIYRRVEGVYGKLCCGGRNYFIEWLVLVPSDGSEVVIHIGDDMAKTAQTLLEDLKAAHPEIQYGKDNSACSELSQESTRPCPGKKASSF